ncbi:hypothetical protein C8R43DRAFT_266228 [Mycena crocata]|nr:hypothetical protein C8R43DRAFT_266228 [Mycena crocata]
MKPRIPSETSDIIIDHLFNDVYTLRQCSLVCKEWLPASRFHIFSIVHLSLYSIDPMLEVIFYPGSPIPQYIREFHIIDSQGREFDPKWVNEKLPLLPLNMMTCISSLSLEQVDFSGLSRVTMAALRGITPRINRLELTYCRFEDPAGCIRFLKAAVSLVSLTSCVTTFDNHSSSPRATMSAFLPELVELELESDDDPLLHLISSADIPPRIRAVSLYLSSDNISSVARSLARLGSSLSHLHIYSFSFDPSLPGVNTQGIDLSKNPHLKIIIFDANSSQWIIEILNTAVCVPLECVHMELPMDYADFHSLGSIFMAEGSALRRTEINLSRLALATFSAATEWLEEMNLNHPDRVRVRERGVTLREFRPDFM